LGSELDGEGVTGKRRSWSSTANRRDLAEALVCAVEGSLATGVATSDIGGGATTAEMTAAVIGELSGILGTGG
jgi:hypothetical protein